MVGVCSPALSPWLAWTSCDLGADAGRRTKDDLYGINVYLSTRMERRPNTRPDSINVSRQKGAGWEAQWGRVNLKGDCFVRGRGGGNGSPLDPTEFHPVCGISP